MFTVLWAFAHNGIVDKAYQRVLGSKLCVAKTLLYWNIYGYVL